VAGYIASPAALPAGYYDQLPAPLRTVLEGLGIPGAAPVLVGLVLLVVFELLAFALRRSRAPRASKRALSRLRAPIWLVIVATGYFANPDPALLTRVDLALLSREAAAAAVVLVLVVYEGGLAVWRWRRSHR
jgi:sec-independent protein translocase protein TatC